MSIRSPAQISPKVVNRNKSTQTWLVFIQRVCVFSLFPLKKIFLFVKNMSANRRAGMCPTWWPTVALALVVVAGCVPGALGGSCREAALCCNGRDSSCVVQKAPLNAIIEDLNDKPCYCDHACLRLGDCCDDFKAHCGGELDFMIYFFLWLFYIFMSFDLHLGKPKSQQ